ncbi:hypothetical protein HYC85_017395 [Camellia sinensis]|uniref:Xylanase inhibitor C-terminal domain-containing protein n=1 Tax=Camellia sinensis TaxID=4442 RepID=A0A7J7GV74_CAMSI|nr:hypothetical protein HYC85_017395 [Camellia sinensis]
MQQSLKLATENAAVTDPVLKFEREFNSELESLGPILSSSSQAEPYLTHLAQWILSVGRDQFDLGSRILSKLQFYYYRRAHYNVILKAIEVGHDVLQLPTDVLDSQSGKAVVIDSGTTLAYLADDMFTPLMEKIMATQPDLKLHTVEQQFTCFRFNGKYGPYMGIFFFSSFL